jgi:hypothetical protein
VQLTAQHTSLKDTRASLCVSPMWRLAFQYIRVLFEFPNSLASMILLTRCFSGILPRDAIYLRKKADGHLCKVYRSQLRDRLVYPYCRCEPGTKNDSKKQILVGVQVLDYCTLLLL